MKISCTEDIRKQSTVGLIPVPRTLFVDVSLQRYAIYINLGFFEGDVPYVLLPRQRNQCV